MNGVGLAGLLIIGIMGSTGMSYLQHRYYSRKVNELLAGEHRPDAALVSGRHKGKVHGAIALLMVRGGDDPVIDRALLMEGASVFARFREHPEVCGRAGDALDGLSRAQRGAVEDALGRYHDMRSASAGGASMPPSGLRGPSHPQVARSRGTRSGRPRSARSPRVVP